MLIDDDLISTLITKKVILTSGVFEKEELSISIFNFPEQAISHLEKHADIYKLTPIFILLDINMPILDGFQVLDIFNEKFKDFNLHVFMLTSSISQEHKNKACSYSLVKKFFVKPFTLEYTKELKYYMEGLS